MTAAVHDQYLASATFAHATISLTEEGSDAIPHLKADTFRW